MSGQKMPLMPGLLAYGGLIPFIGLAALSLMEPQHGLLYRGALLLYGAVILSFVGAVHWGVAMVDSHLNESERNAEYAWSVIPALIGWVTYIFAPLMSALLLILGFVLQYWVDIRSARKIEWPSWYLPLRVRLTTVAIICLAMGTIPLYV